MLSQFHLGLKYMVTELREAFDIILLDLPGLLDSEDGAAGAQLSDGVFLMLNGRMTRKNDIRDGKKIMGEKNIPMVGSVFINSDRRCDYQPIFKLVERMSISSVSSKVDVFAKV